MLSLQSQSCYFGPLFAASHLDTMDTKARMIENERYAQALFDAVLQTANQFLHNCQHFSISILAESNPTYAEIAELMGKLSKIILALADDFDPMLCQKAFDYCLLMKNIGEAIKNLDEDALSKHVVELQRKPFL